jgi:hypothetical protein
MASPSSNRDAGTAQLAQLPSPGRVHLQAEDIVVGAAAVLLAGACLISPASSTTGPILCPFRALTGLPCPGCGMTRAWVAAAHGHVVDSFLYNPYGLAFFLIAAFLVAWRLVSLVRPALVPRLSLMWLSNTWPGWIFLVSWAVFGFSRLGYLWATGGAAATGSG